MQQLKIVAGVGMVCFGLTQAAATGTIGLENRTDFMLETYDGINVANHGADSATVKTIGKDANYGFNFQRIRLNFAGDLPVDAKYQLRLRFDKLMGPQNAYTTTTTTTASGSGAATTYKSVSTTKVAAKKMGGINLLEGALDIAYIQPQFTPAFNMKIGRFAMAGQGYEQGVLSPADVYAMSSIEKNYSSYAFGIRPTLKLGSIGSVSATLANSDVTYSDDLLGQQFLTYGGNFTGKFSIIEPVVNVYMRPMTSWSEGIVEAGGGVKISAGKYISTVDFQSQIANGTNRSGTPNALLGAGATMDSVANVDKLISANLLLQYKGDNLRPQAKFFYDKAYWGKDMAGAAMGFSAGTEFYPSKDAKYRYHLMATDKITTPYDIANKKDQSTTHQMKLYAGVNCNLDLWKY